MWIQIIVFSSIFIKHITYSLCNNKPTEPTDWTLHHNKGYYYLESNNKFNGNDANFACPSGTTKFYIKTSQDYSDYLDIRSEYII